MNRHLFPALSLVLAALLPAAAGADPWEMELKKLKLSELEQSLEDIDSELGQLASLTLRRGVGSLGYRSAIHRHPDEKEWVRIELEEETAIDGVVLTPALYREPQEGVEAEGFPKAFRILAGTGGNTNEIAVVSVSGEQTHRIAPLAVSFPAVNASWIIIEATTLTPRLRSNNQYFLQLSEIMVFSGSENVALHQPVSVPANAPKPGGSLHHRFLVDGFTPYVMGTPHGTPSKSLLIFIEGTDPTPALTLDLKAPCPVNQINFHSADLTYAIPKENLNTWAVPRHVRVTGANQPDFSDAAALCEYRQETLNDYGPITMRRFPETRCRYIRFEIADHTSIASYDPDHPVISFAEIEVISKGRNAARHAPLSVSSTMRYPNECLMRITDGVNYYGEIIPQREWMTQLSRRHDLELLRPLVAEELHQRYERQKINLRRLGWLAGVLAAGIVIAILIERLIHHRQLSAMQERFAADLHDELGADLHTIGLLSDLADDAGTDRQELSHLLKEIRSTTEETGEAVRMVARMNSRLPYMNLIEMMQQAAERVVVHLNHDFSVEGEEFLKKLKPRKRLDLFLFYKESLINICRHSEATKLSTHLKAAPKQIELTISDNGHGLPDLAARVPKSLKRRARLMGAEVHVETPTTGGTRITLRLRLQRLRLRPKPESPASRPSTFDF